MVQKVGLTQEQKLTQQQQLRLSQQQIMAVRMIGMPLLELEKNIQNEIDDNPALDVDYDNPNIDSNLNASPDENEDEDFGSIENEKQDELNTALENMGKDDEMPDSSLSTLNSQFSTDSADYEEMIYGNTESFYDSLNEQMNEMELTDGEHQIMEYLIGNLDDDGLLRKDTSDIADELSIYHYMDITREDVEKVLEKLQTFEPAGIGGRNLQECLLLQIKRMKSSTQKDRMQKVIERYFDNFKNKRWQKIQDSMHLTELEMQNLISDIKKLNPKPGAALGETIGRSQEQVTPDFIVYTEDGKVWFDINNGNIPNLMISDSFIEMSESLKGDKEATKYIKDKIEKANWYIDSLRQRHETMQKTMQAIINWQKKFFLDGEEADLKPMILKDIAEKTGYDISTISRVSNQKYAQTQWGTFPLKFFFTDGYETKEGDELSTKKIKLELKEIIDHEDKKNPMSDEQLTSMMKEKGFPIARRTIAKYREQMGIPVARLRR